jgi:uncharacterized protein YndB with AHSA1/START domain
MRAGGTQLEIIIETLVKAELDMVWTTWNNPEDINQWATPSVDWQTTQSSVDLREGGRFSSRMEARDGSAGFDFEGTYHRIVPRELIEYTLGDGRAVKVQFSQAAGGVLVRETFEAESEYDPEFQRQGWQAILDNFARFAESK